MPKAMAQYPTIRACRQYRVHHFEATVPVFSVLGYWATILGILKILEFQVYL